MESRSENRAGVIYTITAFSFWGLSPIYWKLVSEVPAVQLLGHRVVWSLPCLLLLLVLRRQGSDLVEALEDPRTRLALLATTLLIGVNWLLFIWAINTDRILQASLGYYINPLVNVALGALLLGERLSRAQGWAVVVASAGVGLMAWQVGSVPWIAVGLAGSFALYGLVRKVVAASALVGLTLEVALLTPIALWGLYLVESQGHGAFIQANLTTRLLLVAAGLVTTIPLLLFTEGARRLRFSTVGFLQYLAPSGQFLLAVMVYGEDLSSEKLVSFSLIWASLVIYSLEARRAARVVSRYEPVRDNLSVVNDPGDKA